MAIKQYLMTNPLYERFRQTTTGRYLLDVFANIKRTEGLGAALSNTLSDDWNATRYRFMSRLEGAFDSPRLTADEQRVYDRAVKIAQDTQEIMRKNAGWSHEFRIRTAKDIVGGPQESARYTELVRAADAQYRDDMSRAESITPQFTPEIERKLRAYRQRVTRRKIERLDALL